MKKRWIAGLVVFLLAAVLLVPQLAADMDFFFSRQLDRLTMNPLDGWTAVISNAKVLRFYLLLNALVALVLGAILLTGNSLDYRSKMWEVTPDIRTPCADGQGQFGTAKWLKPEAIAKFYGIWRSPGKAEAFLELMEAGECDRKEIQDAQI